MKIRPLPDLDLARIAPLPTDQKRNALETDEGRSTRPTPISRRAIQSSKFLNVDAGPLGLVGRAPWAQIADQVSRRSRSEAEETANLDFASALYHFADAEKIAGRRHDFFPLAIGTSSKVSFWLPAVVSVDGCTMVAFIDPRRTKKLTSEGRRFAFSVMNERIRAADPDFDEVELAIIQFGTDSRDPHLRIPALHLASGVKLFDFDTLDTMVRETYELWHEVLSERDADARRRGTGTTGPLI